MVREVPEKFRTEDGKEFSTREEAERHGELLAAMTAAEKAKEVLGRLLAERVTTADGQPFRLDNFYDYHYIAVEQNWLPVLKRVGQFAYQFQFGEYNGKVTAVRYDFSRDHYLYQKVEVVLETLYENQRAATIALLAAQEAWLAERSEYVQATRDRLRGVVR